MQAVDFSYELPETAIAQEAIEPRDASRLLRVADMSDQRFADLPTLLNAGDLLVVNRTRVRRARLRGSRRVTGGAVELLLLTRRGDRWDALVRPARRMRPGVELDLGPIMATVMTEPSAGRVEVELECELPIEEALRKVGEIPLPPYFHGKLDDDERYQTVFAQTVGSAAAPTAALHFTPRLLGELEETGISLASVDLEVGLDTFRPMEDGDIDAHQIHSEKYDVPSDTVAAIEQTRQAGGRVVAVGTTVARALETAAVGDRVAAGAGASSLFIRPGYRPQVIDTLITNFHAPRTTLVVLVAALLGSTWRNVYEEALRRGYRFLSFGDAMLLEDLRRDASG